MKSIYLIFNLFKGSITEIKFFKIIVNYDDEN